MESQRLSPLREEKTWFAALTEELEEFLDAGGIDLQLAACANGRSSEETRMAPPEYRPAPLCRGRVIRLPGVVGTVPLRRIW